MIRRLPLALLALAPAALTAQRDAAIAAAVERLAPRMIEIRHDLHQHPELSNRETRTAALVADELRRLGFEVRTGIAKTGVVGILRGGKPGPVVAIRADMDALPVTEQSDLPFRSTARGVYQGREVDVFHACGHDVHTASQLGVANILAGMRAELRGTVMFIFQPAEEGAPVGEEGGAGLMVREGIFADLTPRAVLAFHTNGDPPDAEGDDERLGNIVYSVGPTMAAATRWAARVIGRPAHGSTPHLSVDAAVTASQIVLALQTIRSRSLSPFSANVVTVGVMRGGERNNIIPGEMVLEGTIRTFNDADLDTIERRMREIFDGITRSAGATFTIEFDRSHPMTVNDTALTRRLAPTLVRVAGAGHVREALPRTGAEDFSYFARLVPGLYVRLGVVPEGRVSGGHHTPTFYADDQSVPFAMRVMTALVLDALDSAR